MPGTVETQVGVAKIYLGLKDATIVTLTGAATVTAEDADLEHNFDIDEHEGQDGNIETMIACKERLEVTINFAPNGATRAAAITSAANMIPGMLTKVILAGFAVAKYNGDYNYIGGMTIKTTKKGVVMQGLKLRAHIANRASLTQPVIAG